MGAQESRSAESVVSETRRKTRRKFSSEEKIRIVLEGLKGEESISALCRREGVPTGSYYRWSKDSLEAGKKRLMGDTEAVSLDDYGQAWLLHVGVERISDIEGPCSDLDPGLHSALCE